VCVCIHMSQELFLTSLTDLEKARIDKAIFSLESDNEGTGVAWEENKEEEKEAKERVREGAVGEEREGQVVVESERGLYQVY